ncbi:MAG TPA: carboxypeptidase-like regulatory domain-containing protein [Atribacteraceae bacterium]|nr:carboxypeptidase-like regulatory domain-containing protein [Atribacteraceae bacterium]
MKKTTFLLVFTGSLLLTIFTGCVPSPSTIGEPGLAETGIKGYVMLPLNECLVPELTKENQPDNFPLGNATVYLVGNNGDQQQVTTDGDGFFEVSGLKDDSYLVYANLGNAWLAKGVSSLGRGHMNDIGELNVESTAQVVLFDISNQLYPGSLSIPDIHFLQPSRNMIERTAFLLSNCQNPLEDERVSRMARTFARVNFGSSVQGWRLDQGDHLIIVPLAESPFEFEEPSIVEALAIWIANGVPVQSWNVLLNMMIDNPNSIPFQYTTQVTQHYNILMSQQAFTEIALESGWGAVDADVLSELNLSINTLTTHQAGGSWSPFVTVDWGWAPNSATSQWTSLGGQLAFSGALATQFQIPDGIIFDPNFTGGSDDPLGIVNIDFDSLALQIINYLLGGQINEVLEIETEIIAGTLKGFVKTTFQVYIHSPYGQLYDQAEGTVQNNSSLASSQ